MFRMHDLIEKDYNLYDKFSNIENNFNNKNKNFSLLNRRKFRSLCFSATVSKICGTYETGNFCETTL